MNRPLCCWQKSLNRNEPHHQVVVKSLTIHACPLISEMPSNETYVAVGGELALNCSLSQSYPGILDASYLYFTYTSKRPAVAEYVLDRRTCQLKIPRVQRSDAGVFHCSLNETSIGEREKSLRSTATVIVHVGGMAD